MLLKSNMFVYFHEIGFYAIYFTCFKIESYLFHIKYYVFYAWNDAVFVLLRLSALSDYVYELSDFFMSFRLHKSF